ncbi:hypothetical protein BTO32_03055 [Marinobacter lutaoensis]|uniref:PcRGLX/YetA-like N-terminal RIFT barrel domain-containing protein n=1 Tax=Marinobacter lutaoensis TaxID=135739 RepID=A0A1V2DY49_9GAMM|nr:hypothetical protein [Marinobacter lutaoensis]ONF45447.1 hypothetical protein BTO32_03055 [Marinobacter lutaoensis]
MELCRIQLAEDHGMERIGEPILGGVPFARGQLSPSTAVRLRDPESGEVIPLQTKVLGHWKDSSVRWLRLGFHADLGPRQQRTLILETEPEATPKPVPGSPREQEVPADVPAIEWNDFQLQPLPDTLGWRVRVGLDDWLSHQVQFEDATGQPRRIEPPQDWSCPESGPLFGTLQGSAPVKNAEGRVVAILRVRLTAFRNNRQVRCELGIHNPRRASHPGGLWDLGDPGSVYFKALTIRVTHPTGQTASLRPASDLTPFEADARASLEIYQDSSGGHRWNSSNHQDADGQVIPRFQGYRVTLDGQVLQQSLRATPVAAITGATASVRATLAHFWQNFPSSLGCLGNTLEVGFFPRECASPYELQGGERKTQTAWFQYGNTPDALNHVHTPTPLRVPADHYAETGAFPWFSGQRPAGALERLIDLGIASKSSFFKKREVIDEYGWRNFGDLYADHETLYQAPGDPLYLSHYNNQYDAIYGFARQFALTGDVRWHELMDDLARHVADIDIYHTEEDRAEYNGGLFWHTDHYLDAHTATHRTYSRHNSTSSIPGQTGGGPAAEHCYTTGLLYHHWLTGSPDSRAAVLELAHWIRNNHEGTGGLLEQLLKIKKQDLPRLRRLLRKDSSGVHQYPFTRGTGNYLNTLLDASLVEPEADWLAQAERVIQATISPEDSIEQRHLLDAETGWSYLILLASLTRYLWVKVERQETRDPCYQYTLTALHRYWQWMAQHEHPFLEKADTLEYPNHTWVAQDIRKAMLMFQAAAFDPRHRDLYRERGDHWLDYVVTTLRESPERMFTRTQVILLQNYGPHEYEHPIPPEATRLPPGHALPPSPPATIHGIAKVLIQIGIRLALSLLTFRLSRERQWLSCRQER